MLSSLAQIAVWAAVVFAQSNSSVFDVRQLFFPNYPSSNNLMFSFLNSRLLGHLIQTLHLLTLQHLYRSELPKILRSLKPSFTSTLEHMAT